MESNTLSSGAVLKIVSGGIAWKPLLQVLDIQPTNQPGVNENVYRLVLSDGECYCNGMLAAELKYMAESQHLKSYCIVKATDYNVHDVNDKQQIVEILQLEKVSDPVPRVGDPQNVRALPPLSMQQQIETLKQNSKELMARLQSSLHEQEHFRLEAREANSKLQEAESILNQFHKLQAYQRNFESRVMAFFTMDESEDPCAHQGMQQGEGASSHGRAAPTRGTAAAHANKRQRARATATPVRTRCRCRRRPEGGASTGRRAVAARPPPPPVAGGEGAPPRRRTAPRALAWAVAVAGLVGPGLTRRGTGGGKLRPGGW